MNALSIFESTGVIIFLRVSYILRSLLQTAQWMLLNRGLHSFPTYFSFY